MNQVSLRQSSGGSTAFSWNCNRRCVLVKEPAFSAWPAAGKKKISVAIFSGSSSPRWTSGESFQNAAVSVSTKSRTTSHFRFARADRCNLPFAAPTAGILPHHEEAFQFAVGHVEPVAVFRMVAGNARQKVKAKFVFGGCGVSVPGLEQAYHILIKVVPPASCGRVLLRYMSSVFESPSKKGMGR